MIRLPRDMTSDDVTQWLSGGIFLVRTKTDKELVPVEWSGFRDGYVQGVGFDGRMHTAAHYNCYAVWPELGSFNHPRGYAVHISRRVDEAVPADVQLPVRGRPRSVGVPHSTGARGVCA